MTVLFTLIIVLFVAVAIWQLVKIFDLAQVSTDTSNGGIATDYDNKVNGYLMLWFLAFIYIFTIICLIYW